MDVLIHVVNQRMYAKTPLETFVSGSQKFVKFRFDLSSEWDGLKVFAQFTQNGKSYNDYLDDSNCVYLPPEITEGICTLMLYGCDDTVKAPTNYITLTIDKNILVSDANSTEISESLYNQLIAKVDALDKHVEDLKITSGAITDYNMLENHPSINGVELRGNLTASKLGINTPTKLSQLENDCSFVTTDDLIKDDIPEYWLQELEYGVETINTFLCEAGRNKSAFLFYSDSHWTSNSNASPTLLKYLYNHTGINKTIFGGDIVDNEATDYDTMKYLWEWRNQIKDLPNHHSVVGNHDDGNATNNLFNEQYVYGYLFAAEETPDIVREDTGMYYYIDNPSEKTRYLYLDTAYKVTETKDLDAQNSFITNALKSTPDNWHIIVISHIWYMPDYDQYNVRPVPVTGLSAEAASIVSILDDYNSRVDGFADCNGKVEFCIGGHIHYDYVGSTNGGIPIILVETDSTHIRGTYSENMGSSGASVNGVIADYTNNSLHIVRVGRGNSFDVNLTDATVTQYYSISNNLTNVFTSSDDIEVKQGESYNTTLTSSGVMTSVRVVMNGVDITDTFYNSETGVINITSVDGNIVITAIAAISTNYTNVLPLAVDLDGTIYNDIGYKADTRWSTSGQAESERADTYLSGWIAVSPGDIIRLKNIDAKNNPGVQYGETVVFLSPNIGTTEYSYNGAVLTDECSAEWNNDGNLLQFTVRNTSGISWMRIQCAGFNEASVITINEEIE